MTLRNKYLICTPSTKKQNKMVSANLLHWHINRNHDLTIILFLLFTVSLQILVVQLEKNHLVYQIYFQFSWKAPIAIEKHRITIRMNRITALCVGKLPDLSTWGGSCFPEDLPEGKQIWMFPYTEGRNCFIIFLPMFYRLSPLWGKIGLFGGEQ